MWLPSILLTLALVLCTQVQLQAAEPSDSNSPPGAEKSIKTKGLEIGAKILQSDAPVHGLDIHLVGFHPMKAHPEQQMQANHFCRQVNEDFAQCVLFDGPGRSARLNGIEYIISAKLFAQLPKQERQYWHPHNYEILSGMLIGPGLPEAAEKELMRSKINSYGKTWHVWNTGHSGKAGDALPLGEPQLAWSFNHDGELEPGMLEAMETSFGISTANKRKLRGDLVPLAQPQEGVDALKGRFKREVKIIPGVQNK